MMRVVASDRDMQVGVIFGQRVEHMRHHIGWEVTNMALGKISLEIKVKPSAKIKCYLNKRLIHGQAKAITPYSHFIAKGNADGLTKRNRAISIE